MCVHLIVISLHDIVSVWRLFFGGVIVEFQNYVHQVGKSIMYLHNWCSVIFKDCHNGCF